MIFLSEMYRNVKIGISSCSLVCNTSSIVTNIIAVAGISSNILFKTNIATSVVSTLISGAYIFDGIFIHKMIANQYHQLQTNIDNLQTNVNELKLDNDQFINENKKLSDQVSLFSYENKSLSEHISQFNDENIKLNNQINLFQEQDIDLNKKIENLNDENNKLTDQVKKLYDLYNNSRELLKNLANAGDLFTQFGSTIGNVSNELKHTQGDFDATLNQMVNLIEKLKMSSFSKLDSNNDGNISINEFNDNVKLL